MRSGSTSESVERKSTTAEKSSVLMSGDATLRTPFTPPLSPVKDGSKAIVRKPRFASPCA